MIAASRVVPRTLLPWLATLAACAGLACASPSGVPLAEGLSARGPHRLDSKRNLLTNHQARNADGSINVVVEIPSGTNDKWTVSEDGNALLWEFTGDKPRVVDYLPYPGNYGFIPRTLLDKESGGDGTSLDVLVLGPAVPRGSVVRARAIGIIRVVDRLEQDDKILAVMLDSTLTGVSDLESLDARYPGASEIVRLWFGHAHGRLSKVELMGTGSRGQADSVIDYASETFKRLQLREASEKKK